MDQRKLGKLAALGAVGGALGLIALYAFLAWVSRSQNLTGGIDRTQQYVTWIAVAVPTLLLAAVQLVLARQLWDWASGKRYSY
jgi:hypothetical protein